MRKHSNPPSKAARPEAAVVRIGKKVVTRRSLAAKAAVLGAVLLVAALMLVIGRGHTVLFDNAPYTYQGQRHDAPYRIAIYNDGKLVGKIASKPQPQRAELAVTGQKAHITVKVMETKGGAEKESELSIKLPYSMDGVLVNLPALLAGLPEDAWLSEFVFIVADEPTAEEPKLE